MLADQRFADLLRPIREDFRAGEVPEKANSIESLVGPAAGHPETNVLFFFVFFAIFVVGIRRAASLGI